MKFYHRIIYAVTAIVCAACSSSKPLNTSFVAQRWGEAMGAYDITGVFPPRGGIDIGDVYVVADSVDANDTGRFKRRAILLGKLDLKGQLQQEMTKGLNLPPTATTNPTKSIFTSPPVIVDLAAVGFGGLNIATITDTDLGVSVPVKVFRAMFGASSSSEVVLSVSLPHASHAEVGALDAFESLKYFCSHNKHGETIRTSRCSYQDDGFLASAWSLLDSTDDPNKAVPKILLITHVYYASEIDYSYSDQSGVAVTADVSLSAASAVQAASEPSATQTSTSGASASGAASDKTIANAAPAAGAAHAGAATPVAAAAPAAAATPAAAAAHSPETAPPDAASAASEAATQVSTRAEAAVKSLGITGGTLKVVHEDLKGADLKQVFVKPIVIGIRGIYVTP